MKRKDPRRERILSELQELLHEAEQEFDAVSDDAEAEGWPAGEMIAYREAIRIVKRAFRKKRRSK